MVYYPNPFDEDEEERRRRLGSAADTETEESIEPKPMSEMSTREAVAAAYDRQHPYGGTVTMTGPLGNISYYDEELNKPKEIANIHQDSPFSQIGGALKDMTKEYFLMKSHNYKNLDDYYHCKANYNAAQRGSWGEATARNLGNLKEGIDYVFNKTYKGLSTGDAVKDFLHDTEVNKIGRARAKNSSLNAQTACEDFRKKNPWLPEEYW